MKERTILIGILLGQGVLAILITFAILIALQEPSRDFSPSPMQPLTTPNPGVRPIPNAPIQ